MRLRNLVFLLSAFSLTGCTSQKTPEALVMADLHQVPQALVYIADRMGFFKEENLQVSYRSYAFGRAALNGLNTGEVDVAHVFDLPVAADALAGRPLRVIGTLSRSNLNEGIVGRRDRGIAVPADLAGKRIGLTPGTATDFALHLLCKEAGIEVSQVQRVVMTPEQATDALIKGEVDAIASWQPHIAHLMGAVPPDSLTVMRSSAYTDTSMLVVRPEALTVKAEALRRLMRALVRAEDYRVLHASESRAIVAQWPNNESRAAIEAQWSLFTHQVRLDNLLLTTLTNEAVWLASQQQPTPPLPDIGALMATEFLEPARPQAVTLKLR